jgi:hypothetical protein
VILPRHIQALLAVFFVATLAHFTHNAEFIAFYPGMPEWLTREKVYLAWLCMTGVGVAGLVAARFGPAAVGALLLGAYGALGLDALQHYQLALCSEHTLTANITIWSEAAAGVALALASAVRFSRAFAAPRARGT